MMTISEFARAIGVSPTTVSRAMHGRGRVSPATREMVLQRMQELGYTPNLNAQRLVHGRTYMVALDYGEWHDFLGDMFFVELTRGLQDALDTQDYGLLLNANRSALRRWVKSRAVDGVILATGSTPDESIPREIAGRSMPCVVIGHFPLREMACVGCLVVSLRSGAREVAQMLVDHGHRRIGFICNDDPNDVVLSGFREELGRLGITLQRDLVVKAGRTSEDGEIAMAELLSRSQRPTAVFARTDTLAAGAMRAARRRGVRVPEDISLVGHDDVPFAALAEPPLTTVRVNCLELGRLAVDTLFALLDQPDVPIPPQVVNTELMVRATVTLMQGKGKR